MPSSGAIEPRATIVLVDDHEGVRTTLGELLELEGFKVTGLAATGFEGLELVRHFKPALVVLDQELPDTTGIELAREIATVSPSTKLVLHTARVWPSLGDAARSAGILAVVPKAVPTTELLVVLDRLTATFAAARPRL